MTWNLKFQNMREFVFPNNRVQFDMHPHAISFFTQFLFSKALALITYKAHTIFAFSTVDVSNANSERPCNSAKKQWTVSEQNSDLWNNFTTIGGYIDNGAEVKLLEQNWLRNGPWPWGGYCNISIVVELWCTTQSVEKRQGWRQQVLQ